MMARRYLAVEGLPARPDPESGLPRPPRAPWFIGSDRMAIADKWVRIYELVEVTAHTSGTGVCVTLKDSGGREVEYKFVELGGTDRLLFDLTYNGILHSVIAGGAKTNPLLHRTLKLPYPESARGAHGEHPDSDD
jgi:hypothetical protein